MPTGPLSNTLPKSLAVPSAPPPPERIDLKPLRYAVVNTNVDFGDGYRTYAMFADFEEALKFRKGYGKHHTVIELETGVRS